jgi:DNA-directed RNA polymerase subunit M/transcription elongation factor TFIIS
MKITKENLYEYFDGGLGCPFEEKELVKFCVENQHLFRDQAKQLDEICHVCEENGYDDVIGMGYANIFYLHSDKNINLFKKYVSRVEEVLENDENEVDSISFFTCDKCGKWTVSH